MSVVSMSPFYPAGPLSQRVTDLMEQIHLRMGVLDLKNVSPKFCSDHWMTLNLGRKLWFSA